MKYLLRLLNPKYWLMLNEFNRQWDENLRSMLKNYPVFMDEPHNNHNHRYSIFINNHQIWISNYPYAYGVHNGYRPGRMTIMWLKEKVDHAILNNEIQPFSNIPSIREVK